MHPLRIIFCVIGVLSLLISLPMLGLGALGMAGMAADIGPEENQKIGIQLLLWGGVCFTIGIAVLVTALIAGKRQP